MGGYRLPTKGKKITVGISFPAKGCLTSHSRSEINKMNLDEYQPWMKLQKSQASPNQCQCILLSIMQLLYTVFLSDNVN